MAYTANKLSSLGPSLIVADKDAAKLLERPGSSLRHLTRWYPPEPHTIFFMEVIETTGMHYMLQRSQRPFHFWC